MDETRLDLNKPESEVIGATQRLSVNATDNQQRPRTTTGPRATSTERRKATAEKKKKEKILVITLCSISAVLLIAAIIGIFSFFFFSAVALRRSAPLVRWLGVVLGCCGLTLSRCVASEISPSGLPRSKRVSSK